ncbi:hypothetical protein M407DRAFT_242286 [Tulasnella calospora MUT 4182]|uniref:2Fe-2S ferredoxin-type domain-containing protein n=1 Tax=Tulasnella calospora MUT 4182 TaxID=1051891 RepID=A0A0C3M962_9AGAM|nr:hypothetical protein M407DRAFT_242286 [Tulasnella calospora MUT 4182]
MNHLRGAAGRLPWATRLWAPSVPASARTFTSHSGASSRFSKQLVKSAPRWRPTLPSRITGSQNQRLFSTSPVVRHTEIIRPEPGTGIKIHFKDSKGELIKTIEGREGDSILDLAHEYDVDLEGACEASLACSTCHVILPEEYYDILPEPVDEENDMLDMAFGLTDTSRLGCQVKLTPELDGMTVTLPSATRNMFVDGAKPTKH